MSRAKINVVTLNDINKKGTFTVGYSTTGTGTIATSIQGVIGTDATSRIVLSGFHSANDGGGGVFFWDAAEAKANHNGGTIIDPLNSANLLLWDSTAITTWFTPSTGVGCWKRQYQGAVNPKWFGAKGDGVVDDYSVLNYVASKFTVIDIVSGNFAYSGNITLMNNAKLYSSTGTGKLTRTGTSRLVKTEIAVDSALALAATIFTGDNTITLSGGTYPLVNVGDYLRLSTISLPFDQVYPLYETSTSAALNDITNDIYKQQIVKVISKNGSNTIGFEGASHENYLLGYATVEKMSNFYDSVDIDGINFVNSLTAENTVAENCPINMFGIYRLQVNNCQFDLNSRSGGIFFMYGSIEATYNTFVAANTLAIFLIRSVSNSTITLNKFYNQVGGDSSIFVSVACVNNNISGNSFYGSHGNSIPLGGNYVSSIDLSARCSGNTVDSNTFNGYNVGVRLLFGAYKNVISNNAFENCSINAVYVGNAPYNSIIGNNMNECARRDPSNAVINVITSDYTVVQSNTITSVTVPTKHYSASGVGASCIGNIFSRSTEILFNSYIGEFTKNEVIYTTVGGYVFTISGSSSNFNKVDSNTFIATDALGVIRIANGADCNIVSNNRFKMETGTLITLASTSNAQCIVNNSNLKQSVATIVYPVSVSIVAPAMPTNIKMPRGFRIYSTSTASTDPQGTSYWEYMTSDTNTTNHRFAACLLTVSSIVLPT